MEIYNICLDPILEAVRDFETKKKLICFKIVSSLIRTCFTIARSDCISLSSLFVRFVSFCSSLWRNRGSANRRVTRIFRGFSVTSFNAIAN